MKVATLEDGVPVSFLPENTICLIVCGKYKSDTRVDLRVSYNGKDWVPYLSTTQQVITLPEGLHCEATLIGGSRQIEPVFLHFVGKENVNSNASSSGENQEGRAPITREAKAESLTGKEQRTKPVAGGVQLRHSPPRNNQGGSTNSAG